MVKEQIIDWENIVDVSPDGIHPFYMKNEETPVSLMRFTDVIILKLTSDRTGMDDFRIEVRIFEDPVTQGNPTSERKSVSVEVSSDCRQWRKIGDILPEQQCNNAHLSFEVMNLKTDGNVYVRFDNSLNKSSEGIHTQTIHSVLLFRRKYDFEKEYVRKLRDSVFRNPQKATAPSVVQLDLTNNCNFNCLGCWCHSDLLGDTKFTSEENDQTLSFETVKGIIQDLVTLGTKKIMLAGSGEPLMHPQIKDIISLIKNKGIELEIITNFSLVTTEFADFLIHKGVDQLTISFWAGDEESFCATHPNQKAKTFHHIKKILTYLNQKKSIVPETKLFNVISSANADKITEMIEFGIATATDHLEFQLIDIISGYTDSLRLKPDQFQQIRDGFQKAKQLPGYMSVRKKWENEELTEFGRFFVLKQLSPDFTFSLESDDSYDAVCSKEYHKHTCIDDNVREKGLLFYFDTNTCNQCDKLPTCSIRKKDFAVKAPYLSILNHGHFMTQIAEDETKQSKPSLITKCKAILSSLQTKTLNHVPVVDTIPCYAGHIYSRVLVTGEVIPCCKAEKKPMGNVYHDSFATIWYSSSYQTFRKKAVLCKKNDAYFKPIDCYSSCDNYGMNLQFDEMVKNDHLF